MDKRTYSDEKLDFDARKERLHSMKKRYDRESDEFEEFIYQRRRSLLNMEASFGGDAKIREIYEQRRLIINKMEKDLYECRDEYKNYLTNEYLKIENEMEEYKRKRTDEGGDEE